MNYSWLSFWVTLIIIGTPLAAIILQGQVKHPLITKDVEWQARGRQIRVERIGNYDVIQFGEMTWKNYKSFEVGE